MYSAFLSAFVALTPLMAGVLRVCADPSNLPFSNRAGEGFENRIAEAVGRELNDRVEYTWWPGRRNYPRNTLNAGRCDVIFGLPSGLDAALTTGPYYRSEYVAVYRKDSGLHVRSYDDPALRRIRIGVHLTDFDFTPPGIALVRRGIRNITPFSLYGSNEEPSPPSRIIDAVANRTIDVAFVWGPTAGYFVQRSQVPLEISPMPPRDGPVPLEFGMAAGVRKGDLKRKQEIEAALERSKAQIAAILREYGVPVVGGGH